MRLRRELGLIEAVCYGVSMIIGAGVFVLIGQAAGLAGNSLWVSFLITAFVAMFTGLSYAELSSSYPKVAAEFVYVKKAYGSEFWAFIIGWLLLFTGMVAIATVSLGFAGYFLEFFNLTATTQMKIFVAASLIIFLSFVNFLGIKESSRFNIFFVLIVIAGLGLIILLGFWKIFHSTTINYFEAPNGAAGVFSAAILVFFAYLGFEDVVNISEETKTPKKLIPLALILSVIITTLLYVLVSISVVNLASWQELSASNAPLAFAASKILGNNAFYFISICALAATAGTTLTLILCFSRMMYGMARDKALASFLARIHPKKHTPYIAIFFIALFSIIFVFVGDIRKVARITSLGSLIGFVAVNLSVIHLRFMKPELKRPFKTPFNIGKFPLTAFFGVISCMVLIGCFDLEQILFALLVLLVGAIYFIFHRTKVSKKF